MLKTLSRQHCKVLNLTLDKVSLNLFSSRAKTSSIAARPSQKPSIITQNILRCGRIFHLVMKGYAKNLNAYRYCNRVYVSGLHTDFLEKDQD